MAAPKKITGRYPSISPKLTEPPKSLKASVYTTTPAITSGARIAITVPYCQTLARRNARKIGRSRRVVPEPILPVKKRWKTTKKTADPNAIQGIM